MVARYATVGRFSGNRTKEVIELYSHLPQVNQYRPCIRMTEATRPGTVSDPAMPGEGSAQAMADELARE